MKQDNSIVGLIAMLIFAILIIWAFFGENFKKLALKIFSEQEKESSFSWRDEFERIQQQNKEELEKIQTELSEKIMNQKDDFDD